MIDHMFKNGSLVTLNDEGGLDFRNSVIIVGDSRNNASSYDNIKELFFLYSNDNINWSLHKPITYPPNPSVQVQDIGFDKHVQEYIINDSIMFRSKPLLFLSPSKFCTVANTVGSHFTAFTGSKFVYMPTTGGSLYSRKPHESTATPVADFSWSGVSTLSLIYADSKLAMTAKPLSGGGSYYRLYDREFNLLSNGNTPVAGRIAFVGGQWFLRSDTNSSSSTGLYWADSYDSSSMNWTECTGKTNGYISNITYGNGVYMATWRAATSSNSEVLRSSDGKEWVTTALPPDSSNAYKYIAFVNNEFLIFKSQVFTYTASSDGVVFSTGRSVNTGLSTPLGYIGATLFSSFDEWGQVA